MTITNRTTSISTTRGSTPISSAAPIPISCAVQVLHYQIRHYDGPGFLLAKDVVPGIEAHDEDNDCTGSLTGPP